ncbi:hypothetical protein B0H10DRAFT_1917196 [Mycena sp. CBHHK59/15]|nr:hypothetical protein B0H10DRAFT_1917196 [Mycena sp. CBHHK59/15]
MYTSDSDADVLDSDAEITQELCVPTQFLKLDDRVGGVLRHGITAPFRFATRSPHPVPRSPKFVENGSLKSTYVLLVDGMDVSGYDPDFDWSRHLPPDVTLRRKEHDKILDLSFKFFTTVFLRIVPTLFLRDMHRALSVSPSCIPPTTPHYSPMLHNALLAVATSFSDDPRIRDPKSRRYFAAAAKSCLEAECKKPDVSLVHALGFLATYSADAGDHILADLYCAMSTRLSEALGLGVDSSALVESGVITKEEMLGRNWAHWAIYSLDIFWAIYFGRDFCGPPSERRAIPVPVVDSELDQIQWHYAPANIPPQPNLLTLTFSASTSLLLIARKIVDVVNGLVRPDNSRQDTIQNDQLITKIDLELNNWKSQLCPELDITLANRSKSTPHRLMLHCMYWLCFILLHRPFFNRRARAIQTSDREIDHVKLCRRAAENIMELLETWRSLYTLRYTPVTMLQVVFSAGTVFLLLSLQATTSIRIAHGSLKVSLSQAELCVKYLFEIGRSWRCATRTGDILRDLLEEKLRPILARRLSHESLAVEVPSDSFSASFRSEPPIIFPSGNTSRPEVQGPEVLPASYTGHSTEWSSRSTAAEADTIRVPDWSQIPSNFFNSSEANTLGAPSTSFPTEDGALLSDSDMAGPGFMLPTFDSFTFAELSEQPSFDNRPRHVYSLEYSQYNFGA